ncbi:MAG TPA: hypothetical protein VF209_02990 [Patescibacteria group bacterium]
MTAKNTLLVTSLIVSSFALSACIPGLSKSPEEQAARQQESEAKEMMAAMESGQSLKCSVTNSQTGDTGEYYIKGEKMRMSNTATIDGQTQTSHMINDGEFVYTWTDEPAQGVKMKMPTEEEMKAQEAEYEEYLGDTPDFSDEESIKEYEDSGYTIDCDPTDVLDSQFVPPSHIQFQDMSAMMEAAAKMAPEGGEMTAEQQQAYEEMMKQYSE